MRCLTFLHVKFEMFIRHPREDVKVDERNVPALKREVLAGDVH